MADQPPSTTVGGVTYRVTPEYVHNASVDTRNTAGELRTQLAELKTYVNSLEEVWQGIAHNQFQALMAEYDIYANMLHDALEGISNGLQGNYVNYKSTEQQNLSNLSALGEDLPTPATGTNFR